MALFFDLGDPGGHYVHGAFGEHLHFAIQLHQYAHQLPIGVKGQFKHLGVSGQESVQIRAFPTVPLFQSGFGGVAQFLFLIHITVVAEDRGFHQQILLRFIQGIAVGDGHTVLGQGTGLIGTDHRHTAQTFHRLQLFHNGVLFCHLAGADSQGNGDDGGQSFRNRRYRQRHSKEQGVQPVHAMEQVDDKHRQTDNHNADGQLFRKLVQGFLQGSLTFLGLFHQRSDLADFSAHTYGGDQQFAPAVQHQRTGIGHIFPVAQGGVFFGEDLVGLFYPFTFPGKGAFIHFQAGAFNDPPVGRHQVSGFQQYNVPNGNFLGGDAHFLAVSQHPGVGGGHSFQPFQGFLRLHVLDCAQYGVHNQHRQNDQGALQIAGYHTDQRRHQQHDHQHIRKLGQKHHKDAFLFLFLQLVQAMDLLVGFHLGLAQTGLTAVQLIKQLLSRTVPILFHPTSLRFLFWLSQRVCPVSTKKRDLYHRNTPWGSVIKVSLFQAVRVFSKENRVLTQLAPAKPALLPFMTGK